LVRIRVFELSDFQTLLRDLVWVGVIIVVSGDCRGFLSDLLLQD